MRGRRCGDVASGRREGREQERLLVDVRRVRDVGGAVHVAEDVPGRSLHDAGVHAEAVALRLAEREQDPPTDIRIGLAQGIVAPRPAAVGTLTAEQPSEVARDLAVTRGRHARALLGASHRDRRDEAARHTLGALVDIRHQHPQLVGHRTRQSRLHRHVQSAVLGVRERREVDRLERAVLRHDAAGRGRLGRHIDQHRQLLHDGVREIAGPGRGERDLRGPLGFDLRGPAHDDRLARVDRDGLSGGLGDRDALCLERDVHGGVGLRGVADERTELCGVADAQDPRQRGTEQQRLCREELVGALADHRVAADRARLHAPGGEIVGHLHVDARGAVVLGGDLRAPVRGVAEVLPELLRGETTSALALLGELRDHVVPPIDRDGHRRARGHAEAALEPERAQTVRAALVLQREHRAVDDCDRELAPHAPAVPVGDFDVVVDSVARLGLIAVGLDGDIEHTGRGRDRQLDVADLVARDGIARRRRPVHRDRNEDVGDGVVDDRDAQAFAVRRELAHLARDDLAALHGNERGRARVRRRDEDFGGVAHFVPLLVRDELDRVVVGDLPARVRAAPDPEVRGRTRDAALLVGRLGDQAQRPGLRRLVEHAALALCVGDRRERGDERVLHVALVAATAARDELLGRDPLAVVDAHHDVAIRRDLAVGVDGHEIDPRIRVLARHELRGMDARVERRGMHGDRRAAGDDLTVLIGDRGGERELLRAFRRLQHRGDAEARDTARACLGRPLRAQRVPGHRLLGPVVVGERIALVALDLREIRGGERGPVERCARDAAAEEERRGRARLDRVAVDVGRPRCCHVDLELGLAEFGDEEAIEGDREDLPACV